MKEAGLSPEPVLFEISIKGISYNIPSSSFLNIFQSGLERKYMNFFSEWNGYKTVENNLFYKDGVKYYTNSVLEMIGEGKVVTSKSLPPEQREEFKAKIRDVQKEEDLLW